ncbi:hypothetical protein KEM55_002761, partial [Ascosphaera atra]
MASRRPGQDNAGDNDLLGLNDTPIYNTGQRPPVNDEVLLERFNIDDADAPTRPSVSYDSFVGGRPPGPGPLGAQPSGLRPPAATTSAGDSFTGVPPAAGIYSTGHAFSQSEDLDNYHRYSDLDNVHDDDFAADDTSAAAGARPLRDVRLRDSTSMGGFMGRAKSMLGMKPDYSEMDLPLTEAGARNVAGTLPEQQPPPSQKQRFSASNFKFGLGRKKVDPRTLGPRIIYLNNPPANAMNKYVSNSVSTAKYNVVTFIPKFLYEQFSKYANLFFLFTAVLQQIPNISPTNRWTTVVPLVIVLLVSAIKESVEDARRRMSDRGLNNSKARVLRGSTFEETSWVNIKVGDVVRVESEESFPADLILLASSEPEGLCYIETANLDGETNLKVKQAIPETADLVSPADLSRLAGKVKSEQPNSSLYTYEATLTMQVGGMEKELPLAPDQLLLRGATLRNTPWVHGIVVFTGHETKLMRNATATPIKRTAVENMVNMQILMLVAILVLLSLISSIGDLAVRIKWKDDLWYLDYSSYNGA